LRGSAVSGIRARARETTIRRINALGRKRTASDSPLSKSSARTDRRRSPPNPARASDRSFDTLQGIEEPIGILLADGGYWNSPAIGAVRRPGIDVLIPTQDSRRTRPRKLASSHPAKATKRCGSRRCYRNPKGQALYRRCQQIVEPVFAHTKCIRRTDRFLRRGLAACEAEWQLPWGADGCRARHRDEPVPMQAVRRLGR
jgi:hypothetical protein